jgi:hypothetical protein
MTTKKGKNIITFADLNQMNEGEEHKTKTQTTKATPVQSAQDDWEDSEPTGFTFAHQGTQQPAPKAQKKKAAKPATWDQQKDDKPQETPVEPAPVPKDEFVAVKKPQKIMNLPFKGGQAVVKKVEPGVNIGQEYFPSLGEEMPVLPDPPKKERVVEKPVEAGGVTFSRAPPKFTTGKKIEHPTSTREESPPHTSTQSMTTQSPPQASADGKFKFGEKKSFMSGAKVGSDKKPAQKTEEELRREQKEREVDERLQKQRDEEQKAREERLARKGPAPRKEDETVKKEEVVIAAPTQFARTGIARKVDDGTTKEETVATPPQFARTGPARKIDDGTKKEEVVAAAPQFARTGPARKIDDGTKKEEATNESAAHDASKEKKGFSNLKRREEPLIREEIKTEVAPVNGQEVQTKLVKKNPKPRNADDNGEKKDIRRKPKEEKTETPKEEPEVKEDPKSQKPQEVIAVNSNVTAASWDTGVLKKVPKKKAA